MAGDQSGADLTPIKILAIDDDGCDWCGEQHGKLCPFVKAFNLDPAGNITRVEFVTMADMAVRPRADDSEPEAEYPKLGNGGTA